MASVEQPPETVRRVVLVGFMGSGKSTVGVLLASRLGWSFLDFDDEIERRAGASVADIFREKGEAFFRVLEHEVGCDLLAGERVVLATGGGWPTAPGHMDALGPDTLSVWLDVSAESSVSRVRGRGRIRPLLEVADPVGRARLLLGERAPHYGSAELHLDSTRSTPEELADRILEHMRVSRREGER
jgi:shikimate kinase